jgi:hypothetical protein
MTCAFAAHGFYHCVRIMMQQVEEEARSVTPWPDEKSR